MEITLRHWCADDWKDLQKLADHEAVSAYLRNAFPYPYTNEDAKSFLQFAAQTADDRAIMRAILADGKLVGGCSLIMQEDVGCRSAEIGYWLGKDWWHKGIATKTVQLLCDMGFAQKDLIRLYAEIFAENAASASVLEKNGFQLEGRLRSSVYKRGKIMDSLLYGRVKDSL